MRSIPTLCLDTKIRILHHFSRVRNVVPLWFSSSHLKTNHFQLFKHIKTIVGSGLPRRLAEQATAPVGSSAPPCPELAQPDSQVLFISHRRPHHSFSPLPARWKSWEAMGVPERKACVCAPGSRWGLRVLRHDLCSLPSGPDSPPAPLGKQGLRTYLCILLVDSQSAACGLCDFGQVTSLL